MRQYAVDYYTAHLVSSSMELNTHARKVAMRATGHARRERVAPPRSLLLRGVPKISSCWVNTTSRRGIKRLRISFGSIFQ